MLVQGRASFNTTPDRAWLESITPQWDQFLGKRSTGLIGRTQRVYYWERIAINVQVERVTYYRESDASGEPEVFGAPPPPPPAPQKPPGKGTEPRVEVGKVASSIASSRTRCSAGAAPRTCQRWSLSRAPRPPTRACA